MKYKCFSFIRKNDWLNGSDHGWGNGYVAISKEHPLFKKHYSDKIKVNNIEDIPFNGNYLGLMCAMFKSSEENMVSLDVLINVHCGLTYSDAMIESFISKVEFIDCEKPEGEFWVFGFDTCHCDDNQDNWTKENVIAETLKLKEILENFEY